MDNIKRSNIDGYAVSGMIKQIIEDEGFVALRIVEKQKLNAIKVCETVKISSGEILPTGADTVIDGKKVRKYARIIFLDDCEEDLK